MGKVCTLEVSNRGHHVLDVSSVYFPERSGENSGHFWKELWKKGARNNQVAITVLSDWDRGVLACFYNRL